MAIASHTRVFCVALLELLYPCYAVGSVGSVEATTGWSSSTASLSDLEEPSPSTILEETSDDASFMAASTEVTPASDSTEAAGATGSALAQRVRGLGLSRPVSEVVVAAARPRLPDVEDTTRNPAWETNFAAGASDSKKLVEDDDKLLGDWLFDSASGAAVPARMLQAELLLQSSTDAPAERWKDKTAERALRIYHHAKWLAERNYARAAEHRYREAHQLAKSCRRSVLASHALARLGYFLVHWGRQDEAQVVLQDSMRLNTKSNPLAPYLHGVLERRACDGDMERLKVAEDQILTSGKQPSEELEEERSRFIADISYWRQAENSPQDCFAKFDAAYVLICVGGHAVTLVKHLLLSGELSSSLG